VTEGGVRPSRIILQCMKDVRARHGKMCCILGDYAQSVGARVIDCVMAARSKHSC
jgi:hypothetical protein